MVKEVTREQHSTIQKLKSDTLLKDRSIHDLSVKVSQMEELVHSLRKEKTQLGSDLQELRSRAASNQSILQEDLSLLKS